MANLPNTNNINLASDLKTISSQLALPPFSKNVNAIQLHDDYTAPQLLLLLTDVMRIMDVDNPQSWHKNADIRTEDPEDTVIRMGDFLRMLKFQPAFEM